MIEVDGYKAFYGTILTQSSGVVGPCDFLYDPNDSIWKTNEEDFYEDDVLSVMPYVNISACRGDKGNPDCDTQDNCFYEVVEIHKNVTVEVCRCKKCGNIDISWYHENYKDLEE